MYLIQKAQGKMSYCFIVGEKDNGYIIKICRDIEGYVKESEDYIEKELFDLCLRTGYIKKVAQESQVAI